MSTKKKNIFFVQNLMMSLRIVCKSTACTIPPKSKHVFAPQKFIIVPNMKLPVNEPIDNIDPIQETSISENRPEVKGVSSDLSSLNADETHPIPQPYPSTGKFAESSKKLFSMIVQFTKHILIFYMKIYPILQLDIGILCFETPPFFVRGNKNSRFFYCCCSSGYGLSATDRKL